MSMDETIARINELSRKQKSGGLTDSEREEQSRLRQIYLAAIRKSFRAQLDQIEIVDDDKDKKPLH